MKEQKVEESMDILDKNGLSMNIEITVRFHRPTLKLVSCTKNLENLTLTDLSIPEVRSSARKVMGRYEAEEIYSTKRNEVESAIIEETKDILAGNNAENEGAFNTFYSSSRKNSSGY